LTKEFKHLNVDIKVIGKNKHVVVEEWFGTRVAIACISTCVSHIKNMMTGVTKGFLFKMRMVYAHFPISVTIENNGKQVDVRNFLGEKVVRTVHMLEGVDVKRGTEEKDQIVLAGNSLEAVSQSAANIHNCALVRHKDIRKFLDGIYVSSRGHISADE